MSAEYILSQGNPQRRALRARREGLRQGDAQPVRRGGGAAGEGPVALADHRRSQPRHGPARLDSRLCLWPASPRAPTACTSKFTTARRRPCPTARRRCCRSSTPRSPLRSAGWRRFLAARFHDFRRPLFSSSLRTVITIHPLTTHLLNICAALHRRQLEDEHGPRRGHRAGGRRRATRTRIRQCRHRGLPAVRVSGRCAAAIAGSPVGLGAQNMYYEAKGAFTGEISPTMLANVGCKYVILGHSERRTIFRESNDDVNKKAHAASPPG